MENPIKVDDLGVPLFSETSLHIPTHKIEVCRGAMRCKEQTVDVVSVSGSLWKIYAMCISIVKLQFKKKFKTHVGETCFQQFQPSPRRNLLGSFF